MYVMDGVRVRKPRDRTVCFILSRLLNRKKLQSMEDLILTTLKIYTALIQKKFKVPSKRIPYFAHEAKEQIDRYLKVKLYGYSNLKSYYNSI